MRRLIVCITVLWMGSMAPIQAQSVEGADGVMVEVDDATRVVALGGSVTETVYALGAGSQVVGVDLSSGYPPEVSDVAQLGYFRRLSAEGVISLAPTLVLASEGTGPPAVIDQIRSAGVPMLIVPSDPSVEGTKAKIRLVAEALQREEEAEALIADMEADMATAGQWLDGAAEKPRVLFIYARGAGTANVAGVETSADTMIRLAGGENAVQDFSGFRPLTPEAVVQVAPDVILMMEKGLESIGGVDGLMELPGVSLTPAGRNRSVVAIDDLLLLGFGPRLGQAVLELARGLHPEHNTSKL
ncbi:MAG: ABC transporter substrate-binding protein [Bacteroidota bacterium]